MGSCCQRIQEPGGEFHDPEGNYGKLQRLQEPCPPCGQLGPRDPNFVDKRDQCCDGRCFLLLAMVSFVVFLVMCAGIVVVPSVIEVFRKTQNAGGVTEGTWSSAATLLPPAPPGSQPTRLRVTNGCKHESLWLARVGKGQVDSQNIMMGPLESYDVAIPESALGTSRFWAKWRCVPDGNSCAIGDSGGPDQKC